MPKQPSIIYTITDEAPALATQSFLPIVEAFTCTSGVFLETKDISLASRLLNCFPEYLKEDQRVTDALGELGELVKLPDANIIKLPNISASVPQMNEAISELQNKGYALPDYPEEPKNDEEKSIKARYDAIKGSAVNPVLREGNSDRRAPMAVKNFAMKNPHSMGDWSSDSKTHVSTMTDGDFYANEKSVTLHTPTAVKIVHTDAANVDTILKDNIKLTSGEIIDATVMNRQKLLAFLEEQINDAKAKGVLFSLHMKATMMKVSDPIIFGHAVKVYFKSVFDKHQNTFDNIGANPKNGFGDILNDLKKLSESERKEIEADIKSAYKNGPELAMVDSDNGITNLHVPSDVIIDASMPAMIRNSGKMYNATGKVQDAKAVIPDSSYAGIYQEVIDFCKKNGAFDPKTMGTVPNVGLMAQKAEEYGSHDKTFEIKTNGVVKVMTSDGKVLIEHPVESGDIWRMCQTKDLPVKNWIKLAVSRSELSNTPAVFWLDKNRAHDNELIKKINAYLPECNTTGLDIKILSPVEAMKLTLVRLKEGKDTISVTGNVLRDYLTDLFPILELGTSAKMLSIVPLINGGGLFETGAGGSAPKHVSQLTKENHLRWDSLGEFLALAESLQHFSRVHSNENAKILGDALNLATDKLLENRKTPKRKVNELDNRGSHFYLALYWSEYLSKQDQNLELKKIFSDIYQELSKNEAQILEELNEVQGQKVDLKGYYKPDAKISSKVMRPSELLNNILKRNSILSKM